MLYILLLGLCAGSFVNAWIWRTHKNLKSKNNSKKYSIITGRSVCVDCGHQLHARDLIPVVSWLSLGGKCRYCKKPISKQYPIVEVATAAIFVGSYLFWPVELNSFDTWYAFILWLAVLPSLITLFIFDLKWYLLPNTIIYPTILFIGMATTIQLIFLKTDTNFFNVLLAAGVGGGIFQVLFTLSKGKWIGGGDVKLGYLLGILCLTPLRAMEAILIASLLGCIFVLPAIITKKLAFASKIQFGPFLILGTAIIVIWGQWLTDWYLSLFNL